MNLQERAYAAAIFVIIGICCLGAYVAVSGFENSSPSGLGFLSGGTARTPTSAATAAIQNDTPVQATLELAPTSEPEIPTATPIGFRASPTSLTRGTPSPDFLADIPTATPPTNITMEPSATAQLGCGSPFCPRQGPPSPDAPTGNICPGNYLWGFVYDRGGQGLAGVTVQFKDPGGNKGTATTKGLPDPVGRYDIPASTGGTWFLQFVFQGSAASPSVPIQSRQNYSGGPICPTRMDFVQQ